MDEKRKETVELHCENNCGDATDANYIIDFLKENDETVESLSQYDRELIISMVNKWPISENSKKSFLKLLEKEATPQKKRKTSDNIIIESWMSTKHMSLVRELYNSGDSIVVEANSSKSEQIALKFHTDLKLATKEMDVLLLLGGQHHCMKLLNVYHINRNPFVVTLEMPFYDCYLKIDTQNKRRIFLHQLLLVIIGNKCIIHFDIKPANVLHRVISGKLEVVLTDFDVSATIGKTPLVGTLEYLSPEFLELKNELIGTPVDIWAAGVVFAELVLNKKLIQNVNIGKDVLYQISQFKETFKSLETVSTVEKVNEIEEDLLTRMLQIDPKYRISAKEALNHKYFKNIDENYYVK